MKEWVKIGRAGLIFAPLLNLYHYFAMERNRNQNKKKSAARTESVVESLTNLEADRHGMLRITAMPSVVSADASLRPLTAVDSATLLCCRGRELLAASIADGAETAVCELPAEALCAASVGGAVTVMTQAGPFRVERGEDGGWTAPGVMPALPAAVFSMVPAGSLVSGLPAMEVDAAVISAKMLGAYTAAATQADAAGLLLQPVMAAWRLRDRDGRVLHVSEPVAVVPEAPALASCSRSFAFTTDDKGVRHTSPAEFSAPTFNLQLDINDTLSGIWSDTVASLEVLVSPQFHPVSSADGTLQFGRDEAGSTGTVAFIGGGSLRGIYNGSAASAGLMAAAAARFAKIARVAAVVAYPFKKAQSITVPVSYGQTPLRQADELAEALAEPVTAEAGGAAPELFAARQVAVAPGAVAWSGITRVHAPVPSPANWALKSGDRIWEAVMRVRFANGDCLVERHEGAADPVAFSPFVSYPEPDVTEVTVALMVDGAFSTLTLNMHNDATGTRSIAASTATSLTEPLPVATEIDSGEHHVGAADLDARRIIVGPSSDPLNPAVSATAVTQVRAIVPARSTGATWDFGRSRFLVFTAGGTELLVVNAALTAVSLGGIAGAVVAGQQSVCDAGDSVYALTGDGVLTRFSGTRAEVIDTTVPGDRLAFLPATREVLTADTADNVARVYPLWLQGRYESLRLPRYYELSLCAAGAWLSGPAAAFTQTSDRGLVCLTDRRAAEDAVTVGWRMRRDMSAPTCLHLSATSIDGHVTVSRRYLSARLAPVCRLRLQGIINAPLRLPALDFLPQPLVLTGSTTVSSDFLVKY